MLSLTHLSDELDAGSFNACEEGHNSRLALKLEEAWRKETAHRGTRAAK